MRKMTAVKIVPKKDSNRGEWIPVEKITCEVTGEMCDGTKVWTEIKTGEQYYLTRMLGNYMFYQG